MASAEHALTDEGKTERFHLRVTAEEASLIRQAASMKGQTVTKFLVDSATQNANAALIGPQVTVVSEEVYNRILAELEEEPKSLPGLAELIKRPRRVQLPNLKQS